MMILCVRQRIAPVPAQLELLEARDGVWMPHGVKIFPPSCCSAAPRYPRARPQGQGPHQGRWPICRISYDEAREFSRG